MRMPGICSGCIRRARLPAVAPIILASLWILVSVGPTWAAPNGDLDPDEVRRAIDQGIQYLSRTQNADNGSWSSGGIPTEGLTPLCALALVNAGVEPKDPRIRSALSFIDRQQQHSINSSHAVYAVSLETMVYCAVDPKQYLPRIRTNAKWLETVQIKTGPTKGAWNYGRDNSATGNGDNSNSQFALLALYEAQRAGVDVSSQTWILAKGYWDACQSSDGDGRGAWSYAMRGRATGSMTCAGIAAMVITDDQINRGDARVDDGRVLCCGEHLLNDRLDNGLKWLERHFTVQSNPGEGQHWLYYLYGLERAGRMTNRRFIGRHDWYREGTSTLLNAQDRLDGSWTGAGHGETDKNVATSLALLFLSKGRRPVLVAKLKYSDDSGWNRHRNDLANLTSYVEKQWQRDLTWQIVEPSGASVDDLLQSKVLFLNGDLAPQFSDEDVAKLRAYIDRGGFIFAESCCEGGAFELGFEQLMKRAFPEEEYRLALLPPSHPIWGADEPVNPKHTRPLKGINVGCRTAIVFCPQDLSCYWELARVGRMKDLPAEVLDEVKACLAIGINVLAYATNREVKYKYEIPLSTTDSLVQDTIERGKLRAARLAHGGGCNTAPTAATNLLMAAAEKLDLRVDPNVVELSIGSPRLFQYPVAFMHGRHGFRLLADERKNLKSYLERGGVVIADAICSNKEFDAAFRREIAAIFPEQRLERIPATHAIFSTDLGGEDVSAVSLRKPERSGGSGGIKVRTESVEPYFEGIKIEDRYVVIYSRYDMSCALENHESLECEGYARQDAARLGLNTLIYALQQ